MQIVKLLLLGILLSYSLLLTGCDETDSVGTLNDQVELPRDEIDTSSLDINASKDPVNLTSLNGSSISVISSGEVQTIKVRAFSSNGSLDTLGDIIVQYPDKNINNGIDVGIFTPSTAEIINGIATFEYKAPSDLQARVSAGDLNTTFVFYSARDASVQVSVRIDYIPTSNISSEPAKLSKLILSESNITVTLSKETKELTLFAYTDRNTMNISLETLQQVDDVIINNGIDAGHLPATLAIKDGIVKFIYTAPSNLELTKNKINATTFTFYDEENPGITAVLTVNFTPDTPTLRVESPTIILTQDKQVETVTILAFDGNNQAFKTGTILVEYPNDITNGTVSGGIFSQSEATIVNGKATFSFTGPTPLAVIANQTFIFKYKEDQRVSTSLNIQYTPEIATVLLPVITKEITLNSESISIAVNVIDATSSPFSTGKVKIIYPTLDVSAGRDIGSFESSEVTLVNGMANFVYTAPKNLDANRSDIVFSFYHDSAISSAKVYTITLDPVAGQKILSDYTLTTNFPSRTIEMNLKSTKSITFSLNAVDENNNTTLIEDSNITSIVVELLNTSLADLEDTNSSADIKTLTKNQASLNINTNTLSGIVPIRVTANFRDLNNAVATPIIEVFNVVIFSGPPTALSLSYAGTNNEDSKAKFVENWVLTATDKYSNLVNTTPAISMGMLTGYAENSANTGHLYSSNGGTLTPNEFNATGETFVNIDLVNDKLVTFANKDYIDQNEYRFNSYGKWDIDDKSNNILTLLDDYNGTNGTDLGYAVGHNFRNETCTGDSALANVYAKDNKNILDATGSLVLQVEYDYYLVGKKVVLWSNLVGEHNNTSVKVGIGRALTLRGIETLHAEEYPFSSGFKGVIRVLISVPQTGTYYQNANFSYSPLVTGGGEKLTFKVEGTSMANGIDSCINGGVAYVDINITDSNASGTVSLSNILVNGEF